MIVGQAGTGKTTITRKIVEYARSMKRLKVVGVALTHKARRVLEQVLNRYVSSNSDYDCGWIVK